MSDELNKIKDIAKRDLYIFAKGVLGFSWFVPHIHMPLCRLLELYDGWNDSLLHPWEEYQKILPDGWEKDKGLKKLLIVLPRGWLKTTLGSQAYPLWRAIRDPNVRVLVTQNTYHNAVAKLLTIKNTVEKNELFRALFPELLPSKDCVWRGDSLCLSRPKALNESTFEAAGTRTQVISRHYDLIIEDDTVAPELSDLEESNICPTKEDIEQAIGWHRLVPPLLISPKESQNLVIGTRWFEKDLISWIQQNDRGFQIYERACREDEKGRPSEDGKVTYPERFDDEVLESLESSMGPYLFSCLYLNKPLRSKDMVFHQEWIKFYEEFPLGLLCYTTVDLGGDPEDTKGEPDYNVVLTCGKDMKKGTIYVLDYWRKKCSPGEVISEIFNHVIKYHPVKVGLETVQYQKSLKYWIRERQKKEGLWFLVEGLTHTRHSKNARIMGLQPLVANGTLLFRKHMNALISELLAFPLGKNDDLIDALASQLELWQVTMSRTEETQKLFGKDPLSVDEAIKEIRERKDETLNEPLVFDVYREPLVFA